MWRVGQEDDVDVARPHGAGFPVAVEEFAFLEHAAIDEDFCPVAADVVLRAGHFPGRAEELDFHASIARGTQNRGNANGQAPPSRQPAMGIIAVTAAYGNPARRKGRGWLPSGHT